MNHPPAPRPNLYASPDGYSVEILGRTGLRYRDGRKSIYVDAEVLGLPAGIAIYQSSIRRLESAHDWTDLPPDERTRILRSIVATLNAQGTGVVPQ